MVVANGHKLEATELTGLVSSDSGELADRWSGFATDKVKLKRLLIWVGVALALLVTVIVAFVDKNDDNDNKDTVAPTLPHYPPEKKSTQSKYKHVQYVGFQVYTGGAPAVLNATRDDEDDSSSFSKNRHGHGDDTVINPECQGLSSYGQVVSEIAPKLQCYIGNDDASIDIKNRFEIIKDAVERAYQVTKRQDDTLYIFMAPEFYWRGIDGAYHFQDEAPEDPEICGPVCQLLQSLEGLVADARFQDWLFVFGTVIAVEDIPMDESSDDYDSLFYNFAPVYKGYDPAVQDHTAKRFLVPKRYVSSSDFLTPQRYLNASVYKEVIGGELPKHDTTVFNPHDFQKKRYDNEMWLLYKDELESLGYTMIEYDWFMMDGLSMTLEICFDHQMRTALNSWTGDAVTGRYTRIPSSSDNHNHQGVLEYVPMPNYQAQISLVSSAGMQATPESLALTNGGVIFLQDGLTNESNQAYWGVEGCELGLQFDGGTEAVTRSVYLSPTDVVYEHTALQTFTRHNLYHADEWEDRLWGVFSTKEYEPQVIAFDPVDIAHVMPW